MGHAHHFLSRLDRLTNAQHLEDAKLLYNDSGLLGRVLRQAALPANGEKVAISLDDPINGPWLITTGDGRFVTCLGVGMKPSRELPRVPPDVFKSVLASDAQLRGYFDAFCRYTPRSGAPVEEALVGWALKRPHRVALEDARALAGLSLVAAQMVWEGIRCQELCYDRALSEFARTKAGRRRGQLHATIKSLLAGEAHLVTAHLVSFGVGQAERVGRIPADWGVWLRNAFALDSVPSAVRVMWSLRRAPNWLDAVQARLRTCSGDEQEARLLVASGVAGILGSSWPSSERLERLSTLLGSVPPTFRVDDVGEAARTAILQPAASVARAVRAGRALYQAQSQALPLDHPHRYSAPDDVAQETALATLYSVTPAVADDVLENRPVVLVAAMPHFLNADLEALYLPRSVLDALTPC